MVDGIIIMCWVLAANMIVGVAAELKERRREKTL